MAAAKVDIDTCTLFLYVSLRTSTVYAPTTSPTNHIHAQNLAGPCIHSVHIVAHVSLLYMEFPRPHASLELPPAAASWCVTACIHPCCYIIIIYKSCSQSILQQPLLAKSHDLHMGSCDRVYIPSMLLYNIIMLKSLCNQLIVYEWCRMTYSWNDLHRRRWSLQLGDEAIVLYGICTHTMYDGWLWGQRLTVCPVM